MDIPLDSAMDTDLIVLYVAELCVGIDIRMVQEIHRATRITRVPLAPPYIAGVLNLRGRIVTIVDPKIRLGIPGENMGDACFHLIVFHRNEPIGLLVDRLGDVVSVPADKIEKIPVHVGPASSRLLKGIVQTEKELISIVDLNELFRVG